MPYPQAGLLLLSLGDGSIRSSAAIGSDPVAVIVSPDGTTAYVADNDPGDVYGVRLPDLKVRWKTHTGGAPFGLLLHADRLVVSLYDEAAVDELDPASGRMVGTFPAPDHPATMTEDSSGGLYVAGGGDFGTALVNGDVWTADYQNHELFDTTHPRRVALPQPLSPFWLSPGASGALLIAAEGTREDSDPGAVFSYSTVNGTFETLAQPRDPDQVLQSGQTTFAAAHGEHDVLAIGERTSMWATGAAPVALAPDPPLDLLVVVTNAHE